MEKLDETTIQVLTVGKMKMCHLTHNRIYQRLGLPDLLLRVVSDSDSTALNEFHEHRTPFRYHGQPPMRLVELVRALEEAEKRHNEGSNGFSDEVVERASDLTVDKYSHLPQPPSLMGFTNGNESMQAAHTKCTDCRKYYGSFLKMWGKIVVDEPGMSQLKAEEQAARLLQGLVLRQFKLSLLDSRRAANPTASRYGWHTKKGCIYVWFPSHFPSSQRHAWLEMNVNDPDPARPEEKERIQDLIDRRLGRGALISIEDDNILLGEPSPKEFLPWEILYGYSTVDLAQIVATEKADRIDCQRPAIRILGTKRMQKLILDIFNQLDSEELNAAVLAERYNLSESTFSRFAGSRWTNADAEIPDLWRNVARTLAFQPAFVEAAQAAGVWPKVQQIMKLNGQNDEQAPYLKPCENG